MNSSITRKKTEGFFNRRNGHLIYDIFVIAMLALICFLCLYPFWNVAIISLNDAQDTVRGGLYFWPRKFTLDSYREVFKNKELLHAAFISLSRTVLGTVIALFFNAMLAYGMSKKDLFGSRFFGYFFVFTMYFGGGVVPYYMVLKSVGLIDNFLVYIIPGAISVYNMILIRIYMESLPAELEESAYLDGAGDAVVLFRIVLPLTKPIASAVIVLTLINSWNAYLLPLLFLQSPDKQTVTLLPQFFQGEFTNDQTKILAAAVMTAIPEITAYLCMQKNFERGMSAGALK